MKHHTWKLGHFRIIVTPTISEWRFLKWGGRKGFNTHGISFGHVAFYWR